MFLAMLSMFLFACSDNDNPAPSSENAETGVTFEISAVNELKDGGTSRGSIYSQEATQHVTPGQQLDEQGAGELLLINGDGLEISEDLVHVPGVDDLGHGLDELTGELEGTGHQVRDVATDEGL